MSRLVRLVAVCAAGGLLVAGLTVATVAAGDGLVSHAATAQAAPLPPLSVAALGGSTVYASDGTTVLAVLRGSKNRKPVPLSQVAPILVKAVLDTEDSRFYLHGGFDIPSTIRALASDSSKGGGIQGGSTIAQQLVKKTYLSSERKLSRKIKEAVLADRLEQKYSKNTILDTYLNTIYLGNGAYGVEAAANEYFNVHASQVSLPQAALLAGLIQDPNGYDPLLDPAAARTRRAEVLDRMVTEKSITRAEAKAANATPLPTSVSRPATSGDQISDYYVQEVQTELLGPGSPLGSTYEERYQALFEGNLKIYTNLDPTMQAVAEQAVATDTPANSSGYQEAMVSIDPATGRVRAMVAGKGFAQSKFDVVTQGTRQPGSGFKIFTLLAALQAGYSIQDTVDANAPCAIAFPGDRDLLTHPATNDEGPGGGIMSVTKATALSMNCAFLRIAHEVGLPAVANMAKALGVSEKLSVVPAMVLGADAVHPIEMAAAYAAVAADGVYHKPAFIDHIIDGSGDTIYTNHYPGRQVVSPLVAREASVAFQAVVQYGTGTAAALGDRPAAGKTGTTQGAHDAWFNGYTPQLETTVWMGSLAGEIPVIVDGAEVYGGMYPAQTWHDFMAAVLANQPVVDFTPPDYSQMPAPTYIDSPSLEADDQSGNDAGSSSPPPSPPSPPPTTAPAPPATTAPATTPPPPPGGPPGHQHH